MKKKTFITLFVITQIVGVLFYIHHHTRTIKQLYKKQQKEQYIGKLEQKKQQTIQQLYAMRNPAVITIFAQNSLNMQPVSLQQIHRLKNNE